MGFTALKDQDTDAGWGEELPEDFEQRCEALIF